MSDVEIKDQLAAVLGDHGFSVTLLPVRLGLKTPDLLAVKGGERFLIELKSRLDDRKARAREQSALLAGEVVLRSAPWSYQEAIREKVDRGVKQLSAYPETERDFCLLWFDAGGRDRESQWQQLYATAYGTTNILDTADPGFVAECFYFRESAFFSHRHVLDGLIATADGELAVWINSCSGRADRFRRSALIASFDGGVVDPVLLESAGTAMIADCATSRADPEATIQHLQAKYQRPLLHFIDVGRMSMQSLVRRPPFPGSVLE